MASLGSGADLNQNVSALPYDLIFMDSEMVRMGGIEAVRRIRSELHFKGVIVAVTGNDNPVFRTNFMEAGANAVFLKPMKLATLKEIISKYFENRLAASSTSSDET